MFSRLIPGVSSNLPAAATRMLATSTVKNAVGRALSQVGVLLEEKPATAHYLQDYVNRNDAPGVLSILKLEGGKLPIGEIVVSKKTLPGIRVAIATEDLLGKKEKLSVGQRELLEKLGGEGYDIKKLSKQERKFVLYLLQQEGYLEKGPKLTKSEIKGSEQGFFNLAPKTNNPVVTPRRNFSTSGQTDDVIVSTTVLPSVRLRILVDEYIKSNSGTAQEKIALQALRIRCDYDLRLLSKDDFNVVHDLFEGKGCGVEGEALRREGEKQESVGKWVNVALRPALQPMGIPDRSTR
jgi:hypothetical protein